MNGGFTKVYSSLLLSTVWREPNHVRLVWITMLALSDAVGRVEASIPGLADAARVTLEECEDALRRLMSPDPYSRTKDHEGRRIADIDGGWRLLNYRKYRDGRDPERRREQNRDAQSRWREKHKPDVSHSKPPVSQGKPPSAQAEAEAEANTNTDHHQIQSGAYAPGGGAGVSEDPGRETPCPLDLLERLEKSGAVAALAEKLPAPIESVRHELRQFVSYWTIGKGAGQRRTGWLSKARQRVVEQFWKPGGLAPPGSLEHRRRGGKGDEPGPRKSSLTDADRKELAKMGIVI